VIINSAGGSVSEAWGIVDFMESSNVKFNTICRGAAWSAAAIILLGGTNRRFASKRSSIMLHQPMSSMDEFTKFSDLANLSLYATQQLDMLYDFISSRSNKDKNWWANTLRQDFWISAPEAQQLNIIDAII
jgi:ATP-dependent Clp protease protease subunit